MSITTTPWRNSFIVACFVASTGTTFGQQFTATIVPATYNGYHVSCFGLKDGSATVQVTGGEPPYTYDWSMGGNTATVTELAPGYIKVKVYDAGSNAVEAEYTLMEPAPMKLVLTPFKYPSGNNISCHECFNGSIDLEVSGGVAPYSYIWDDDITTPDRSGLGAMKYSVQVVDANTCKEESSVKLEQPEKATWGMVGNANTDPATHYIGTSDNTDVVFKANGQESLRLKANGDISLLGNSIGEGPLFRMEDGTLRGGGALDIYPELPPDRCRLLGSFPYWETRGNSFSQLCPEEIPKLGTLQNKPLRIITNDEVRMTISADGKVGVGTSQPDAKLTVVGDLRVANAEVEGDVVTSFSPTTGPVLWARNSNGACGMSIDPNGKGHILRHWDVQTPVMTFDNDRVDFVLPVVIGDATPQIGGLYKLYVEGGVVCRDVKVQAQGWPDYVFTENYALPSLPHLRSFVQEHGHLPHIPSACELEEQDGYEVGDMQNRLLRTVEEQALYILQLEERLQRLEHLFQEQMDTH